jgi:gamma-glutamylcyclotransferase (GGCT)/AIG2-like uncharacterized protein YtfP
MRNPCEKIFVYGTLMHGFERYPLLKDCEFLGRGFLEDFCLRDFGPYPFIERGKGKVWGEVYQIDEQKLKLLDEAEGCPNLFTRERVEVKFGEFRESAWAYVGKNQSGKEVEEGDYAVYKCLGKERLLNYFAYGANVSKEKMKDRGASFIKREPGVLKGYALRFNKLSDDGTTRANIEPEEGSKLVYGVLYTLTYADLEKLDWAEGYQTHYKRTTLPTLTRCGVRKYAEVYVALKKTEKENPPKCYVKQIVESLREMGWKEEAERLQREWLVPPLRQLAQED